MGEVLPDARGSKTSAKPSSLLSLASCPVASVSLGMEYGWECSGPESYGKAGGASVGTPHQQRTSEDLLFWPALAFSCIPSGTLAAGTHCQPLP